MEERATFLSSARVLRDLNLEIKEMQDNVPEGKYLVLMMRTPDGRMMLVETIRSTGFSTFSRAVILIICDA
jgi:hypothetical protein